MREVVLATLAYVLGMRLVEVLLSRRNRARVLARGGRAVGRDGFGPIALVHAAWIAALAAEETWIGPTLASPAARGVAAAAFVASEVVRFACIAALGDRWNVRVVVEDEPPVRRGPYAVLRHPNYAAAAVGLVALPLALGLVGTALAALPAKLWALRGRTRVEEEALGGAGRGAGGAVRAPRRE